MPLHPLPLPPTDVLLATAEGRLRRQRGYARPLAGRPGPAARLEAALVAARSGLARGLAPAAAWRPVAAVAGEGDLVALEGTRLAAPRLVAELAAGGAAGLWLCTLGPLAERAAPADPLAQHVAADLAQQALFAAARAAHAVLAECHPGRRVVRVALRPRGAELWDAAAVVRLLPLLGPAPLGVTAPDGTALHPAHTLLGVVVVQPGEAHARDR